MPHTPLALIMGCDHHGTVSETLGNITTFISIQSCVSFSHRELVLMRIKLNYYANIPHYHINKNNDLNKTIIIIIIKRTQCLDDGQLLYDGPLVHHPHHTQSERHCHHDGKAFWDGSDCQATHTHTHQK